ncbi:Gfo/Idh/MocA family protein [Halocynthiibacter styelae]|uniref:Gfo/Idh/MocA family oxidoreductase n=1 Tax=Halocynthiibacter styelae TaxID=2761955 RepID=A0A8J7LQT1_9RHOB|nr:Gfo/Idh/MocA family oxidoreductase [Paenihalocynthiibacter styelae]MBI1494717.1 Gfo/Idh/MocA family oxidoreductase [Paenihalocynthiibacter styelae]
MIGSALVIGLGSIGRRHLRNLATRFPDADLHVLRHRDAPDAEASAMGATLHSDPGHILEMDIDLVVLATPSANHIDLLPRLIAKGCHLLVEKPIVSTMTDCDLVLKALQNAPAAVRVSGFNFRYLPSLQKAQALIASGTLGQIARASFTAGLWLPAWRPDQDYTKGYSADAARGGGVEMDLVHEIDVARWFFGDLKMDFAKGGHQSHLTLQANDTSLAVLSGAQGGPFVQIALDYVSRRRLRHYEIVGDASGLHWDLSGTLEHLKPEGVTPLAQAPEDFDVTQTYLAMFDSMAAAIACDTTFPHPQSLEDGIASTRLAIEIRDKGSSQ